MKPCAWCGTMTRTIVLVELARSTVPTNIVGNMQRRIKAPKVVPCCDRCKARITAKDESTVDFEARCPVGHI